MRNNCNTGTGSGGRQRFAKGHDARAKDGGREPTVVAMLLDEMRVELPPECLIREVSAAELDAFVRKLRPGLAARALPPA
jgi:hypothetical protein